LHTKTVDNINSITSNKMYVLVPLCNTLREASYSYTRIRQARSHIDFLPMLATLTRFSDIAGNKLIGLRLAY